MIASVFDPKTGLSQYHIFILLKICLKIAIGLFFFVKSSSHAVCVGS